MMEFIRANSFRGPQKADKMVQPPDNVSSMKTSSTSASKQAPPPTSSTCSSTFEQHTKMENVPPCSQPEHCSSVECQQDSDHLDSSDRTIQTLIYPPSDTVENIERMGFSVADGDTTISDANRHPDFVILVPTPRTSSPIPKSKNSEEKLAADKALCEHVDAESCGTRSKRARIQEKKPEVGVQQSPKRGRHGVDLHLHKTVGRLKQYFGITGGCRASSSTAAAAETDKKPADKLNMKPMAADGKDAKEFERKMTMADQRKRSQSDPLDPSAVVRRIPDLENRGKCSQLEKSGTTVTMIDGETLQNHFDSLYGPGGRYSARNVGKHGSSKAVGTHRSRSKVARDRNETVPTIVPGIRVRVATSSHRSTSSHRGHHGHRHRSSINVNFDELEQFGNPASRSVSRSSSEAAQARARANVERWLLYNRSAQQRSSVRSSHHHRHDPDRQDWNLSSRGLKNADRSASEVDLRRSERHCSRKTSQTRGSSTTINSSISRHHRRTSSVTATVERSAAITAGESRLGPSLVQFVAELIEGLEKNAKDDDDDTSLGDWLKTPRPDADRQQHLPSAAASTPMSRLVDRLTSKIPQHSMTGNSTADNLRNIGKKSDQDRLQKVSSAGISDLEKQPGEKLSSNYGVDVVESNPSGVQGTSCSVAELRQKLIHAVEGKNDHVTTPAKSQSTVFGSGREKRTPSSAVTNFCSGAGALKINCNDNELTYSLNGRLLTSEDITKEVKQLLQESEEIGTTAFETLQHIIHLQASEIVRLKTQLEAERRRSNDVDFRLHCGSKLVAGTTDNTSHVNCKSQLQNN